MSDCILFRKSGSVLTDSVPLGNGHIGVSAGCGLVSDHLILNDISLWCGWKADQINPRGREALDRIRKLFFAGFYEEAESLAQTALAEPVQGKYELKSPEDPFGYYQILGDLYVEYTGNSVFPETECRGKLDLASGICTAVWESGANAIEKEYFVSRPDDIFSFRMTGKGKMLPEFQVRLVREKEGKVTLAENNTLLLAGTLTGGLGYCARMTVVSDGTLIAENGRITVRNASEIRILLTSATTYTISNPEAHTADVLQKALALPYETLKERHVQDFSALYNRVRISMGDEPEEGMDRQEFFQRMEQNGYCPGECAAVFFRFARYLLISASRPGNLPANIQGIWCSAYHPAWESDYHLNGNTQMIYWPAETANLSECHLPLLNWLKGLARSGEKTAKELFGLPGWTVSWRTNIWGYTIPGYVLQWGLFPEAALWMCSHIKDHFEFTGDTEFLREYFPVLKGACEFALGMLVKRPCDGKLVFGPSAPPEHGFLTPEGKEIFTSMGSSTAQELVFDSFSFTVHASNLLGMDPEFRKKLEKSLSLLALPETDAEGMIGKWVLPLKDDGYRHLRHLFGHHPGTRLSAEKTPCLMDAVRKTLEDHEAHTPKTFGSWSGSWMTHHWARLGEGERALRSLSDLLMFTLSPNWFALNNGTFQMDGDSGGLSGIMEMLLQSHDNVVRILPALPRAWNHGSVDGLRIRPGCTIGFDWDNGELTELRLMPDCGMTLNLKYKEKVRSVTLKKGQKCVWSSFRHKSGSGLRFALPWV